MTSKLLVAFKICAAITLLLLLTSCDNKIEESNDTDDDKTPSLEVEKKEQAEKDFVSPTPEQAIDLINSFEFSSAETKKEDADSLSAQPYCLDLDYQVVESDAILISNACKTISNRLASVSFESCMAANLKPTQCSSNNGFPLLYREFPPVEGKKPLGRVLVIGGTHGDELTSVSVLFRWIETLNEFHSGLYHWHIIPLMNPDGLLKRSATRVNGNGVDLNRNMHSDDWSLNALKYWQEKTNNDPRKYPGATPNSEPETQWLVDEINAFQPDAIISVHAPYGVVDFDATALNTAPRSLGKLRLNLLGTYPGSLGNYAGISRNIPTITLELPHSWVMPSKDETSKIWLDLIGWLKNNINEGSQ